MLQCHVTRTFACLCLCLLRPSPFVFVCTCSWHSCVLSVSFIVLRLIKYHAAFLQKLLQTFSHMYSVAPTKMAHFFGQILLNQIAALVLSYFCFKFLKILIIFVSRALIILKLCALRWIWRSRATCATHLILLDFIVWIIFGKEYKTQISSMCNLLHSRATLSILGPNTFPSTLFSNILSLFDVQVTVHRDKFL